MSGERGAKSKEQRVKSKEQRAKHTWTLGSQYRFYNNETTFQFKIQNLKSKIHIVLRNCPLYFFLENMRKTLLMIWSLDPSIPFRRV